MSVCSTEIARPKALAMAKALINAPNDWGEDSLTAYFDICRENQYATYANKPGPVAKLATIDGLFRRFLEGAINPRPFIPMGFFLRAHAAYRAATGAAMAGQLYETQAQLRLCLEHGAYGHFIGNDQVRWERWMARNDSPKAKKIVREEFKIGAIKANLGTVSEAISGHFEHLYEQTIDFGAHPNERGFSLGTSIRSIEGNVHFETIYLHGDGPPLDFCLKSSGQVGLCVLHIAQLIYAPKFQILGITDELAALRKAY